MLSLFRPLLVCGIVATCLFGPLTLVPIKAQTDILAYHGGITSNGVNANEQLLTPSTVNTTSFGKLFTTLITDVPDGNAVSAMGPLPTLPSGNYTDAAGQVYAEPLVKTNVNITVGSYQGTHDVVFVATSMDSLYAIDATTGTVLWKDSFIYNSSGNPNPVNSGQNIPQYVTAVPGGPATVTGSTTSGADVATSDISPWIGIVGTPVIDGGYIYLVAKTREIQTATQTTDQADPQYVLTLHKIALGNGLDTNVVIADTIFHRNTSTYTYLLGPYVVGTGAGAITVNGQSRVYFNALRQMVRPALMAYGGRIYIASGSHGDNGPYHGWILTYDEASMDLNGVWNSTPNGSQAAGGVWQSGAGVVIDSSGSIYFETGNGSFDGQVDVNGNVSGLSNGTTGLPAHGDYGECFVRLALDSTTNATSQNVNGWGLVTADYFSPTNNAALNQGDVDLGSGGPTLLPASAGGTSSHPNLLLGGGKQGILYLVDRDHMGGFGASNNVVQEFDNAVNETFCVPAYFNGRIYTTSAYGSTSGVANSGTLISWPLTNASITTGSPIYSSDQYLFPGCSPWISSNGTSNGVVWAIGMGQLRAYSAATMSELWTSASAPLGSTVKFTTPTPVNGHVYVGTADHLVAYGLISTATAPPNPPTLLTAAATGASTIALNWTDNFNDESGFRIERSADGTNYTEIASVGVNQTTYNDSGLSSQATYYYRVRAYNLYNTISYSTYIYANATTASIGSVLPVYLYHFDEGAGTATIDSASGNNGTLIGSPPPSWVSPGRVGSSNLTFSGTGASNQTGQSAVQVTNNLAPVLGQTSSLLFWIKTNQKGNSAHNLDPAITGAETVGSSNDIDWGYIDGSGHIGVSVGSGSGTSVISQNSISDGQWHHIALTRDSSAGTVQVYVDGVLSTTGTLPTGSISSPFSLIGGLTQLASDGSTFTGANYLNAQLDDVQVYNQVVDASVVASIALAPFAPTNLTVAVAPGAELDLSWTDNANNETAYEVFRSTNGGPFVQISQLAANTVFYADTDVTSGASYSYYVTAVNSAGANNSNTAPPTLAGAPSTPTNAMVAYLSPTEIDLTWTDNSTNETGFRVLRAGSDGNFVTVASLPANTTSFRDTTVTPGTTYGYHIEAYNAAGYFDFTGIEDITTPTQSPYATWFAAYPSITDTTPTDDPNNIGAPNLLAYAFNLDPTKSAVTGLPVVTAQNGYLTISFVERNLPTDLIYTVQVSSDLVTWNSGSTYTTPVSTTAIDSATQRVVVRDNIPISSGSTRFIRVNVSH